MIDSLVSLSTYSTWVCPVPHKHNGTAVKPVTRLTSAPQAGDAHAWKKGKKVTMSKGFYAQQETCNTHLDCFHHRTITLECREEQLLSASHIIMTILRLLMFKVNLGQPVPHQVLFLLQNLQGLVEWAFFTGWVSPNHQCQGTEGNTKH